MKLFKNEALAPKVAMRSGKFVLIKAYKKNGIKYYHHKAVSKSKIWIKINDSNSMCVSIEKGEVIATQDITKNKLSRFDLLLNWFHKKAMKYEIVKHKPKWR